MLAVPQAHGEHVVVLGSSTAEGVGASHPDSAWVARYGVYLASGDPTNRVTNLARGGYTIYHLLPDRYEAPPDRPRPDPERNVTAALRLEPDVIVVNLPSNDTAYGHGVGEQLAGFDALLAATAETSVVVWITTTQPRNLSDVGRRELAALRDSILVRYGDRAIDVWEGLAAPDGRIDARYDSGDGIHLNDRGHGILLRRVVAAREGTDARSCPTPTSSGSVMPSG